MSSGGGSTGTGGAKPAGGPLSRPAPARGPAGGALTQRKRPARTSSGGASQSRALQRSQPGILRFYADEAPGLKIGPTTVLVVSLMFVGFVVLLHIYGKITSSGS